MLGKAFQRFDPLSLASSYCLQFQAESLYGRGFQAFRPPLAALRHTGCSCRLKLLLGAAIQRFDPLAWLHHTGCSYRLGALIDKTF